MEFEDFAALIYERFNHLTQRGEVFRVNTSGDELWEKYLASFPAGSNPIFRERTEHDCHTCRQFIRGVGGIVTMDEELNYRTLWDVDAEGPYKEVCKALADYVRGLPLAGVYRTQERSYGAAINHYRDYDRRIPWHHLHCTIPARLLGSPPENLTQVLLRGLVELRREALTEVEELITSNSLYRGTEHLSQVRAFLALQEEFVATPEGERELFAWVHSGSPLARFRNSVVGTLVQDLSQGVPTDRAVAAFESKVAPTNYRRSSAPITTSMVKRAETKLEELGLEGAIHRRFATLADVSPRDVLWVDSDVRPKMKDSLSDLLKHEVVRRSVTDKGALTIPAKTFFQDVLPEAEKLELEFSSEHRKNLVSLTAPLEDSTGKLFHWDNDFAWVYTGDLADSVKERVKRAGGNVDALLRVSLSWFNTDDLDLHARTPRGEHIYFGDKRGILDVDMNAGACVRDPVENLSWMYLEDGVYRVWVHQYRKRESADVGFDIEVEHGGEVTSVGYPRALRQQEEVKVADITVKGDRVDIKFSDSMKVGPRAGQTEWGITSGTRVRVQTVMNSPNYWEGAGGRGNLHHIFILEGCRNPGEARGFFNEYLRPELLEHRKVFEVLADKLKVKPSDEQLSGVGFSSTRHDRATFVVHKDGTTRTYTVQF